MWVSIGEAHYNGNDQRGRRAIIICIRKTLGNSVHNYCAKKPIADKYETRKPANTTRAHTPPLFSPCNVNASAALTRIQTTKLRVSRRHTGCPRERHLHSSSIMESLPPISRWHPGALLPRSSFSPQWTLRNDNPVMGEITRSKNLSLHTTTAIMYILEVLRGVLYPEAHINGIQKKKKIRKTQVPWPDYVGYQESYIDTSFSRCLNILGFFHLLHNSSFRQSFLRRPCRPHPKQCPSICLFFLSASLKPSASLVEAYCPQ